MFSGKPFSCKLECELVLHTLPWDYSPLFMWIVLAGLRGTRPFIFPNHSAAEEETLRKNLNFDLHDLFGDIIILISFQRNCHRYPLAKKFNSCVPYFRCLTPKPISFSRVEEKKGATEETDWDPCKRVRHHRTSPEKSQTVEQSWNRITTLSWKSFQNLIKIQEHDLSAKLSFKNFAKLQRQRMSIVVSEGYQHFIFRQTLDVA